MDNPTVFKLLDAKADADYSKKVYAAFEELTTALSDAHANTYPIQSRVSVLRDFILSNEISKNAHRLRVAGQFIEKVESLQAQVDELTGELAARGEY